MSKLGIVFSGGGAKGAYEVGVVKYLAEKNIKIDAISGASIGSLNAAIVAGSKDMNEAYINLLNVWQSVAKNSPIKMKTTLKLKLGGILLFKVFGRLLVGQPLSSFLYLLPLEKDFAISHNDVEKGYIEDNVNFDNLIKSIPFYISVYKSEGQFINFLKYIFNSTNSSEYFKAQDFDKETILKLLLASSAIPFIFKPQKVGEKKYYDGGLGDAEECLGNTPIVPLIEKEKCDKIIVVHLTDGSLWNRNTYLDESIIEIRPQKPILRKGDNLDMINFSKESIESWIEQGYEDTKIIMDKIIDQFKRNEQINDKINEINESTKKMNESNNKLKNQEFKLKD